MTDSDKNSDSDLSSKFNVLAMILVIITLSSCFAAFFIPHASDHLAVLHARIDTLECRLSSQLGYITEEQEKVPCPGINEVRVSPRECGCKPGYYRVKVDTYYPGVLYNSLAHYDDSYPCVQWPGTYPTLSHAVKVEKEKEDEEEEKIREYARIIHGDYEGEEGWNPDWKPDYNAKLRKEEDDKQTITVDANKKEQEDEVGKDWESDDNVRMRKEKDDAWLRVYSEIIPLVMRKKERGQRMIVMDTAEDKKQATKTMQLGSWESDDKPRIIIEEEPQFQEGKFVPIGNQIQGHEFVPA